MHLDGMQDEVEEVNVANGWFERDRTWAASCALLASEVYEMFEAYRSWQLKDMTLKLCDHQIHRPANADLEGLSPHLCKPEGVGSELADVWVRWFDTCTRLGMNANTFKPAIDNPTPFGFKQDFSYIVMSMHASINHLYVSSPGTERNALALGRVLRDIFGVAAHTPEIDLDMEFARKLAYNRTRGHHHGGKKI